MDAVRRLRRWRHRWRLQLVRQGCRGARRARGQALQRGSLPPESEKGSKDAAKKFEEVDRQHPYSEWARKSLIMSAYAYYEAGPYDDCINSARRYVTLHPGSPDAAYAQFLIGSSYFDQMPDITRDQTRTEKAVEALDEVVRRIQLGIRGCRQAKDRGRARPAGRQRDGSRALGTGAA